MGTVTVNSPQYSPRIKDDAINFDCTYNEIIVSLYDANLQDGKVVTLKKTDTSNHKVVIGSDELLYENSYITYKSIGGAWYVIDKNNANNESQERVFVTAYGAVADANYYDDTTELWYVDAGFTQEATDNRAFFETALNTNKKVIVPEGNYMIKRHPTERRFMEITGTMCYLEGVGDVSIKIPPFEWVAPEYNLTVIRTEADRSFFKNIEFESKNKYHPYTTDENGNPINAVGLTSNLLTIDTKTASNIFIEKCVFLNVLSAFHKSNPFVVTRNYLIRDCEILDIAIGVFVQRCSHVTIENTKITTNDEVDENGFTIDQLMHCTYYGADVFKAFFINCDFEVKALETGDTCKFAFGKTGDYANSFITDVHFVNCHLKTAGREMFEMIAVERFTATNCHFEFTTTTSQCCLVIFVESPSNDVRFVGCHVRALTMQRLFKEYEGLSGEAFRTPIVCNSCKFEVTGDLTGKTTNFAWDRLPQRFMNCDFLGRHTAGDFVMFRADALAGETNILEILNCRCDFNISAGAAFFTVKKANSVVIVANSVFKHVANKGDLFASSTEGAKFISQNNFFIGCDKYDYTQPSLPVANDVFMNVAYELVAGATTFREVTTSINLGTTDDGIILLNSGSPLTVTLPSANNTRVLQVIFKNIGATGDTIDTVNSETIDGLATMAVAAGETKKVIAYNGNWLIV